ncbi:GH3 domain containing, transcript variant X1 [Ictidomys tridecemlineatus]|uniref:GH3 domain-containing protein isoform X1 n=1 Tax=Ictidomys tridecemlineatus TaxID=43179 RepID=UPI00025DDB51|nr:GH3 domain-containing protein isoform X1 [Ictidomys tridecemlineatus]XP_040124702.1 GH3 domain-containing protein isoform X1 [Ictidomys tridecemlineatus]KAG3268921.1 GH3 domain containing, transcript variant X1 [Ictidomys tridecemlineatus]
MLLWLLLLLLPPLFLLVLLFLLLLLPPLAMLGQRSQEAGLSWLASLQHCVAWRVLSWAATWQQQRLEHNTLHVGQSQQQALMWCLQRAQSPLCPPTGSTGIDMSIFRNHLPLTKVSQAPEEENGEQLLPPTSNQYHGEASLQATLLGLVALNKAYPEVLAPGGTARVTPTSPWPSPLPWPGHILDQVSPPGTKDPGALLLEALRSPGLKALEAGTAVELLDVFLALEADGEELAEAIAAGTSGVPLPGRAAELREALEQGPRGLALRLWPKLQVVVTLDAGGQAEAVAALGALWCQGLAFFSPAYAASGGVVGLNLWPEQPQGLYVLPPGPPFIELLPVEEGAQEEAPSTLLLAEAQRDKEYELVLTDHIRLARCRLGDVVQVVGAYNQCPIVRFVYRLGQALSVRGEVTGENVFSEALGQAVGQWPGAKLLDHICVESSILDSSEGSAPHYEVFVELRGLRNLSEENRDKLDHCLQEASPRYKSLRFRGSVGPARVHLVGKGAFRALRTTLAACPSSSFPPEMPRVLRHRHLAQFLQRRVVS